MTIYSLFCQKKRDKNGSPSGDGNQHGPAQTRIVRMVFPRLSREDPTSAIVQSMECILRQSTRFIMQLSSSTEGNLAQILEDLLSLFRNFFAIFEEPKGSSPVRSQDHSIPLVPGAPLANVQPYRCPHFQKDEFERIIK